METNNIQNFSNCGYVVRRSRFFPFTVLAMLLLFSANNCPPPEPPAPPPTAHNVNARLCFVAHNVPVVDGKVADDNGWARSFRYLFENGSTVPDAAVQGIKDSNNLYLSFEVNKDLTFDQYDVIVITIDPDGAAGNYRRLHIFPFGAGTSGSANNQAPSVVKYWKGDPGAWGTNIALPAGTDVKVSYASAGVNGKWAVEMALPIAGFNIPSPNYFGLYFAVYKAKATDFSYTENRWPQDATLVGSGGPGNLFADLETGTPAPAKWGNATRGSATCNGVSFGSSDIFTNHNPNNVISLNQPNVFNVQAHNSTVGATGNPVAASGIVAAFKWADFGLPSQWTAIPAPGNPTPAPGVTINPNASAVISTASPGWIPPPGTPGQKKSCILVELDSTVANTLFVNRTAMGNMQFKTTSSPFTDIVTVGTRGYELPSGRDTHEFILTEHRYNTRADQQWQSTIAGLTPLGNNTYVLRVARRQDVELEPSVTPPNIRIPSKHIDVPARTDRASRRSVRVPVRPSDLLSVIADRQIDVATTPPGEPTQYSPRGLLMGSWDGFEKSEFLIGPSVSLKVPARRDTLFLSIRYPREGQPDLSKEGFRVQVVETALDPIYTDLTSLVTRDPADEDLRLPWGINLPTWIMCGQRKTGNKAVINGQTLEEVQNVNCFGYIVRRIGEQ